MTPEEKQELEFELQMLIKLLDLYNTYEDQIQSMTREESIEHRLDIMERIAEIQKILKGK
jgi:hypothetical protein